jgi:hypothetical protein
MHRSRLIPVTVGLLVMGVLVAGAGSTRASVPVTASTNDGVTFSGLDLKFEGAGTAGLFLGTDFDPVGSLVEIELQTPQGGDVTAIFPGQGGTTVFVDTGDQILFEYSFEDLLYLITITDIDTSRDFGGGLGPVIEITTMADLSGSGFGVADISLPNIGLLSNTESMSGLLSFAGGAGFVEHPLGVDLNGDAAFDTLRISDPFFSGSDIVGTAPNFNYSTDVGTGDVVIELDLPAPLSLNSSHSVNPSGGLVLDFVEWSMTQTLVAAAVPEPSTFALSILALVGLLAYRRCRA